jgi:hypothetical protein
MQVLSIIALTQKVNTASTVLNVLLIAASLVSVRVVLFNKPCRFALSFAMLTLLRCLMSMTLLFLCRG